MVTLAKCCAAATATTSSTIPYRRLKRLRAAAHQAGAPAAAGNGNAAGGDEDDGSYLREMQISGALGRSCSLKNNVAERSDAADTVVLKVAMVGDCESGKTCFMTKYVSSDHAIGSGDYLQTPGVVFKEKSMRIKNAEIVFSIWELGGGKQFQDLLPTVCEGAAAVIFTFDLTRRSTLKSVKQWFVKARQYNSCAISVLVGTKYDQFIDFPQDIQLTIAKQALFYAETMGAALFFSSTLHNINVHKIFKVIVAKVFDLPCNVSRNYNLGEPIVAY